MFFVKVRCRPVCLHMSRRLDIRRHNYQLMSRQNYQSMLWHFSAACPVSAKDVDEVEYFRPLIFCGRRRAGAALCGMQVNVQSDLPSCPSNSLTVWLRPRKCPWRHAPAATQCSPKIEYSWSEDA